MNNLSSTVKKVNSSRSLIEKELKKAILGVSSTVEKVDGSQRLIEMRLQESVHKLSYEAKRISLSQYTMEEGLNEYSIKGAKFDEELSGNISQIQNTIHQLLKSNAETVAVAFGEVSRDIERLKANMDSIDELSTCVCIDKDIENLCVISQMLGKLSILFDFTGFEA